MKQKFTKLSTEFDDDNVSGARTYAWRPWVRWLPKILFVTVIVVSLGLIWLGIQKEIRRNDTTLKVLEERDILSDVWYDGIHVTCSVVDGEVVSNNPNFWCTASQELFLIPESGLDHSLLLFGPPEPSEKPAYTGGILYGIGYELSRGWQEAALDVWNEEEGNDVSHVDK